MTARRHPDLLIHAFLQEGQTELADQVYDAVRTEIDQRQQRVVIGPWRMPDIMNKYIPIGVGAAAVVVALVIGTQLLGPAAPGGVGVAPTASPSSAPSATPAPTTQPTPIPAAGLPAGPYRMAGNDGTVDGGTVQTTVDIVSSGWVGISDLDFVTKGDDGLDAPATVGAALVAWTWPAGTEFVVYGDPCHWSTTIPDAPATTPDEIAAAFAAQALSEATAPQDVTVGGFAGKAITLHVPMSFDLPNATREERFADCDEDVFGFYGVVGGTEPTRNAQGAGQVDELWILDVDGQIVILDAVYSPATPADLVAELRTLAESATFEVP